MERAANLTLLTGIAGSGKTTALLKIYRDALSRGLAQSRPGLTLWLSPTNRAQAEIRRRLLDDSLAAAFRPNLFTFDGFADEVLKSAAQTVTPLSPAMQRILLRRVVNLLATQGELKHFGRIVKTSGFLDLVAAFISELKRSETWPEHFIDACKQRGTRPRDRELGLIYDRYQQALLTGGMYDGEGRFWSAREELAKGNWGRFTDLSLVVVDGFTDFTEAQYKILELLALKADRMLVALLHEEPLVRVDLFAKTTAVVERFERAGPVLVETYPQPESAREISTRPVTGLPPAIAHLAQRLFDNPRDVSPARDAQGLAIVAVAGTSGEVRYLAAQVKRLLLEGTSPADVVVAVRDLDDYAWLIDEVFSAAGIPYACEAGKPLAWLAPFKSLVNVLTLEVEDWPFRRLLGLLDSGLFRPGWQEFRAGAAVRNVSAELRRCELFEGRERILSGLERAVRNTPAIADANVTDVARAQDVGDELKSGEVDHRQETIQSSADYARKLLMRLSDACAGLRSSHDLEGWSGVTAGMVRELGFAEAPLDNGSPLEGRRFGEMLESILFDAARAERVAGIAPVQLTLREFIGELTDLIERQRLVPRVREEGRVRVLSAEQVRNLDVPHLFLAGLNETSFPQFRNDDCLYGEVERRELNNHGLSLGHRTLRAQEELLMFYGIVTRVRKQLVLTYPIVGDEGQPLSPSPYLTALKELFDPQVLQEKLEEQLDPVPSLDRLLSPSDARIRGMFDALAGSPALFRAACEAQPAAVNCLAAVDMNLRRFQTAGFTNFEGRLENPRNIEMLQARFTEGHEFSATQLEAYAQCPFRFLMSQVLTLEPPAAPEVETDFGRRGTLVHDVLADLHRVLVEESENAPDGEARPRGEEITKRFQTLLEEKLRARPVASQVQQALQRIEQRLLAEWGDAYGRQWDEYVAGLPREENAPPLPARFETAFGTPRPGSEPAAKNLPPLVFGAGPEAVRVGGRIDRIDVGQVEGRTVYTVIDYKTGSRSRVKIDSVETGRKLQLVLYMLAVVRLEIVGPESQPWQMGYWHVKETGFTADGKQKRSKEGELLPLEEEAWQALVQTLEEVLPRLAGGIRTGRFPVVNADKDCTAGCPYNTVCRVAQIRALPDDFGKAASPKG